MYLRAECASKKKNYNAVIGVFSIMNIHCLRSLYAMLLDIFVTSMRVNLMCILIRLIVYKSECFLFCR